MTEVMLRTVCADDFFLMQPKRRDLYLANIERFYTSYERHGLSANQDNGQPSKRVETILDQSQLLTYAYATFELHQDQASEGAGSSSRTEVASSSTTISRRTQPSRKISQMPRSQTAFVDRAMCDAYLGVVAYKLIRRQLLITARGYIGLAPDNAREGDEVTLLPGATVPYLLRPLRRKQGREGHELVGHAYVHGIMYGEAGSEYETRKESHGEKKAAEKVLTQYSIY